MLTATVRDFRDRATTMFKQEEPIMITRRGKIVGFFMPTAGEVLPLEIKRDLFYALSHTIRQSMKEQGWTEETLLEDIRKTRKARRRRQSHPLSAARRKRKANLL